MTELGVYAIQALNVAGRPPVPPEAKWGITNIDTYRNPNVKLILNWDALHMAYVAGEKNPFITETDLKTVETALLTLDTTPYWGIIGPVAEEHFRTHIEFIDGLNISWLGENLVGYDIYQLTVPTATRLEWQQEMYYRMLRGFTNYFKSKGLKVGVGIGGSAIVPYWRNRTWEGSIPYFFGTQAFQHIQNYADFIMLYAYSDTKEIFNTWTTQYLQLINYYFQGKKAFWIITRPYSWSSPEWTTEMVALEMQEVNKNSYTAMLSGYATNFTEIWNVMVATATPSPTENLFVPLTLIAVSVAALYYIIKKH